MFDEWAKVVDCGDVPLTFLVRDTQKSEASVIIVDFV